MVTAPVERDNPLKVSEITSKVEGELSEVSLIDEGKPVTRSKKSPRGLEGSQIVNNNDLGRKNVPRDSDSQPSSVPYIRNELVQGGIEINRDQQAEPKMQSVDINQEFPTILTVELSGNWMTKHVLFVISLPSGGLIRRRYNDFIWLRDYLTRIYIGAFIPPLPERLSVALWPDGYLETRKFWLQLFVKRGAITGFISNDEVWQMFFHKSGVAFEKARKRWDKEHVPLSIRQTCARLQNTFPSIINEPLPEINECDLERQFQSVKHFVQETYKILQKINSSCEAMVTSCVVKIDAMMAMRENLAKYECMISTPFEGESRERKNRLRNVLQKTPGVVSRGWGSWCRVLQASPSMHDVYLARIIKRNLMDFEALLDCIHTRVKVVKDLLATRNRALRWKNVEIRSKDLSQKHADELRLEELELFSRILYKLITKQFDYVWKATQHRFSASMGKYVGFQDRKYTGIKKIWESSIRRLNGEDPIR